VSSSGPLLALAVVLASGAAAGCGGARPAPAPSFADLESCIAALEAIAATPVEKRVQADLTSCGGGRIDTGRKALVGAAEWLARRRTDAVNADRKDLARRVDQVASAVLPVALSAQSEDYTLPESRASGAPVAALCSYTAVKADSVRRESCGMAQLQPHRSPPLAQLEGARSKVIAYPILLVADADVAASRVLAVVMEHEDGAVVLAVQGQGGAVFQHPVELRGEVAGKLATISIAVADDPAAIERSLDAVRGKAEGLIVKVADGVTTQRLVDALDAALRAGFKVVTGVEGQGGGPGSGLGTGGGAGVGPIVRAGQVSGTMAEPVIAMRAVRRHLGAIRGCFGRAQVAAGSFDIELAIDGTGRVTSATIARLTDRVVKSCALAVLERIEFVEAKSGGTIRFPLIVERAP
jgi:hypothetical protein